MTSNFCSHRLNEIRKLIEEHRTEIERRWREHLAAKLEPLARDVRFTEDALHVLLADGREVPAPLEWFPRLRNATRK